METLSIVMNAENAFPELKEATKLEWQKVGMLQDGTTEGRTSVALVLRDPEGRFYFAETTLRLFLTAAVAFKARAEIEGMELPQI